MLKVPSPERRQRPRRGDRKTARGGHTGNLRAGRHLEPGETNPVGRASPCRSIMWRGHVSGRLPSGVIFTGFSTCGLRSRCGWPRRSERRLCDASLFPTFGLPLPRYRSLHAGWPRWSGCDCARGRRYNAVGPSRLLCRHPRSSRSASIRHPPSRIHDGAGPLHDGVPGDVIFGSVTHTRPPRSRRAQIRDRWRPHAVRRLFRSVRAGDLAGMSGTGQAALARPRDCRRTQHDQRAAPHARPA